MRGRDLRVDFLTPARGRAGNAPVALPSLGVAATPLPLLDYLIEEPVQLLAVLLEDRREEIGAAWDALSKRPRALSWVRKALAAHRDDESLARTLTLVESF